MLVKIMLFGVSVDRVGLVTFGVGVDRVDLVTFGVGFGIMLMDLVVFLIGIVNVDSLTPDGKVIKDCIVFSDGNLKDVVDEILFTVVSVIYFVVSFVA